MVFREYMLDPKPIYQHFKRMYQREALMDPL